jgi:hypothetical protein
VYRNKPKFINKSGFIFLQIMAKKKDCQEKNEKNESKKLIIPKLPAHTNRSPCCPGKKSRVSRDKKGREKPFPIPSLCLCKETRWQRDRRAETGEARIGKRGTTAFLGEANAFLRGPGPIGHRERSPLAEVTESNNLSEIIPDSFSTEPRLIQKNFFPPGNKKCGKRRVSRGDS